LVCCYTPTFLARTRRAPRRAPRRQQQPVSTTSVNAGSRACKAYKARAYTHPRSITLQAGAESQSATSGRACAEPVQLLAAPVERVITASRCGPSSLVARALRCKRGEPASSGVATAHFSVFRQLAISQTKAGGRRQEETGGLPRKFGVWGLAFATKVWRLAFGVWRLPHGFITSHRAVSPWYF